MNGTLYLLVEYFSNNSREAFFEKELPYLSRQFKKVIIIALYPDQTPLNFKADNIEVRDFSYFQACNRLKVFLKNFPTIVRVLFFEVSKTHNKWFYFKTFKDQLNLLVLTFSAAANLEKLIEKDIHTTTVFYSYWFKQWVSVLSLIKIKHPSLKIASRIHGGDYDEEQIKSILPFRYFHLSKINRVFPVSEYGTMYLKKKFRIKEDRLSTSRLGLNLEPRISVLDIATLHLVSCSSLIPLKRIHLIFEILNYLKIPCTWTHFGDGELMENLKSKTVHARHQVVFKGYVPNSEFIEFIKSTPVSFFINVSESEGIPVSMMEAISQGISLIGTNICGVPEIVTEETGLLLPVNFNPESVAQKIEELHLNRKFYSSQSREKIMSFYKNFFFAPKNYAQLSEKLLQL